MISFDDRCNASFWRKRYTYHQNNIICRNVIDWRSSIICRYVFNWRSSIICRDVIDWRSSIIYRDVINWRSSIICCDVINGRSSIIRRDVINWRCSIICRNALGITVFILRIQEGRKRRVSSGSESSATTSKLHTKVGLSQYNTRYSHFLLVTILFVLIKFVTLLFLIEQTF